MRSCLGEALLKRIDCLSLPPELLVAQCELVVCVRVPVSSFDLDHHFKLACGLRILAPALIAEPEVVSDGRRLRLEFDRRKKVALGLRVVVSLKIDRSEIVE